MITDEQIFNTTHPPELTLADFSDDQILELTSVTGEQWEQLLASDDPAFYATKGLYLLKSRREAGRLGLAANAEVSFLHNPIALIEMATGADTGRELMEKHGFADAAQKSGYFFRRDGKVFPMPETMWHVFAQRRDGDAVTAFIGDGRGYEQHWTYFIAVCWAPAELVEKVGYIPALL